MRLFLKTGPPQYGRCGTLFWSPPLVASSSSSGVVVVLDERSAGRFSLSSVTDLKSGKHTAVLRSTACNAISQQLCFSLVSSQQELNLQFNSTADKDLWWGTILGLLETYGRRIHHDAPKGAPASSALSPSSSPDSASSSGSGSGGAPASKKLALHRTPEELLRLLSHGSAFKKYDLGPDGRPMVTDVTCFVSGVGRAGLLHWVPIGAPMTPIPGAMLPLAKITDILTKKKASVFRLTDSPVIARAQDDACFALLTDAYTLCVEAASKEQRTLWQDGLIAMLTSAGRQLLRQSGGTQPAQPVALQRRESSVTASNVASLPEAQSLAVGLNVHLYSSHGGIVSRQWSHIFFVPGTTSSDASGHLYYATTQRDAAERVRHPSQHLALGSISEMTRGTKSAPQMFQLSTPSTPVVVDHCGTIIASGGVAWYFEVIPPSAASSGKELRDFFLRNIHAIRSAADAPRASPSPPPPGALDEVRMLREGQTFRRHLLNARGGIETQSIFVWLTLPADAPVANINVVAPGALLFIPASSSKSTPGITPSCFPLHTLQTMVAGKESPLFKSDAAAGLSSDSCMSVVCAALTLDLEAPGMDVRERWIKALHGVMVRHGRRATEQRAAPASSSSFSAAAAATATALSPQPAQRVVRSSSQVSGPVPSGGIVPTTDAHLTLVQTGLPFTVFYTTPKGETLAADIHLFVLIGANGAPSLANGVYSIDQLQLLGASLQWCAAHQRKVIDAQRMGLSSVREARDGKDSAILKHRVASSYASDRCFQVIGSHLTLNLAAQSRDDKDRFMNALEHLLKLVKQAAGQTRGEVANTPELRRSVSEPTAQQQGEPSVSARTSSTLEPGSGQQYDTMIGTSTMEQPGRPAANSPPASSSPAPAVPQAAVAAAAVAPATPVAQQPSSVNPSNMPTSPSQKPLVDHKAAVALLQGGQAFHMYFNRGDLARGGVPLTADKREPVVVYFNPTNGVDSPGTLQYVIEGRARLPIDRSRLFLLGQIKQMCAGKETPILRSALAQGVPRHHCISLFSHTTTWNLEASSPEVLEAWYKALHQVLIRHGMKSSDDDQRQPEAAAARAQARPPAVAAAAAVAPAAIPSPQILPAGSRPLPPKAGLSTLQNRTINFSDPTEFFLLESKIGEGSYGAVYKATDVRDNRAVAVKVLQFQGRDSLKLRKEIHILKECNSPFIVGYKGAFQKSSAVWIVMEYCAAGSLGDIMQICQRTFSEAQISCIMKHALQGLAYLHGQKRIHRDIKSGNILVSADGECKLADFGVSSNLDKALGKHRTIIGTPHFMAPEVLASDDYNELADVWSLGITAYELAIGEPPHARLHSMRAAIKIPMSPPPTLPNPERFSADFHSFIAAALVKDFHTRPSAAELLHHSFIRNAAPQSVLAENVRAAMSELESRHEALDEMRGLMKHTASISGSPIDVRPPRHGRRTSTLGSMDFDSSIGGTGSGAFSSDTMRALGGGDDENASGTMIVGGARGTVESVDSGTMVVDGPVADLSATIVKAASERSGIGSVMSDESHSGLTPPATPPPRVRPVSLSTASPAAAAITSTSGTMILSPQLHEDDDDLAHLELQDFDDDELDDDDDDEPIAQLRITEDPEENKTNHART